MNGKNFRLGCILVMLKKIPFMKLLIAEIADVDILETPQVGKRQQWVHTSQGMC